MEPTEKSFQRHVSALWLTWPIVTLASFCIAASVAAATDTIDREFLRNHCIDCHQGTTAEAGLDLDALDLDAGDPVNLTKWSKIHDRVAAGEMPPADMDPPEVTDAKTFLNVTAGVLRRAWQLRYLTDGRVAGRRLNPLEYETTMRDLLQAPWLQLKEMLPPDREAHGFDNVAAAQEISYVQLARFLEAAEVAIDGAMRLHPAPKPTTARTWFSEEGRYLGKDWRTRYNSLEDRPEWIWFKGQPNNAQAPRHIRNPHDGQPGWYRFKIRCRAATLDNTQSPENNETLPAEMGQIVWLVTGSKRVLGKFDVPEAEDGGVVQCTAWLNEGDSVDFFCATLDDRQTSQRPKRKKGQEGPIEKEPVPTRGPAIAVDWFGWDGPYADSSCSGGADDQPWPSPSYRRLFGDLPMQSWTAATGLQPPQPLSLPDLSASDHGLRETYQLPPEMMMVVSANPRQDAERLLRDFMNRAYRRPAEASEVQRCLAFAIDAIERNACFQDAMRLAFKAVLCSPDFLYLQESPGPLDGYSLASRLSYALWRTLPDQELMRAAASGQLQTDQGLRRQLVRLMDDPRIQRFVSDFAGQWLDLREINATTPDRDLFPEYFSDNLVVDSAVAETEATFNVMLRQNMPVKTIVDADFVMINQRMAEVYDIDGIEGQTIRRVPLPDDSPYGGLLTQCSVMKVTANGLTTSPVLRGVWVMDRILGQPPSPPPPGAGSIEPDTRGATTVRELLDKHRRSETCGDVSPVDRSARLRVGEF